MHEGQHRDAPWPLPPRPKDSPPAASPEPPAQTDGSPGLAPPVKDTNPKSWAELHTCQGGDAQGPPEEARPAPVKQTAV
jgi:hypothetical protein